MIVSLRGTNGSGKSTVARAVMEGFGCGTCTIIKLPNRVKPAGLLLHRHRRVQGLGPDVLFVPGHYEIANGGVDTLPSLDVAYELIEQHARLGCHVLYEGKNMSDGPRRLIELRDRGHDVRAVLLTTPLEVCVSSVRERGHNIAEKTIRRLHERSVRDVGTLIRNEISCLELSRKEAPVHILRWLR